MPREKEWLQSLPLPRNQTVDGYRDWIRHDMWSWWNDRSPMALNRKSETIRRLRRPAPRRLSAAAAIALLREERAKGSLSVKRLDQASPFQMYVLIGYLTNSHRLNDLVSEDLRWFAGMLIELWQELEGHEEWPHYTIPPWALRSAVINAISHFDLADETNWMEIGRSKHKRDGFNPALHAFLNLARRADMHAPDDDHMGELLADILASLLGASQADADIVHENALFWFRRCNLTSPRLRPHMRRWFSAARSRLPDDLPVERVDRLVRALRIGATRA